MPRRSIPKWTGVHFSNYQSGHLSILVKQISLHTLRPFRRGGLFQREIKKPLSIPLPLELWRNANRPHRHDRDVPAVVRPDHGTDEPMVGAKDSYLSPAPGSRTVQLASWRDGWAARQAAASLLASSKSRPWKIMEPARALVSRSTYVTSILHMAQLQIQQISL